MSYELDGACECGHPRALHYDGGGHCQGLCSCKAFVETPTTAEVRRCGNCKLALDPALQCPRCAMVLRFLFHDQRTDDKTGPQIKAMVFAEYDRGNHMKLIEDWLERHSISRVNETPYCLTIHAKKPAEEGLQ